MVNNLPNQQKTDWVVTDIVMPPDTNEWGGAINKLTDAIPVYSACGDYYNATYTNNTYNLTPLTFVDNTSNVTVGQYIDGMSVIFKCPSDNLSGCSVNINSLGTKAIKTLENVTLPAGKLKSGNFIELRYDATNNCFKFIEDITKQDKLYSGTNIKTINDESLLGSGNIDVLDFSKISNAIIESPNGVYSVSNRIITVKEGLKVLIPDGRNTDKTLKNIEYVVPSDVTYDCGTYAQGQRRLVFLQSNGSLFTLVQNYFLGNYKYKSQFPSTMETTSSYFAYAELENLWYRTTGSTTADWQPFNVVPIVSLYMSTASSMTSIPAFAYPIKLADSNMVDGKWTLKNIQLASDVTLPKTNDINYSLADYLPKDHFCYEVLVSATADCSTNGTHAMVYVETSLINQAQICRVQGVANASVSGCSFVPIGTDRTITVQSLSTLAGTFRLWIRGYRRMGLNG